MHEPHELTLFLCGDVMTGRGVDQAFARSCPPHLHESYVTSAVEYLRLAERANGPIPRPIDHAYVWGDALDVLDQARPAARIINLETTITTHDDPYPKGINYRMHPANVGVLAAARIDCCNLATNHVLDWGEDGLLETLEALAGAGIRVAGAGRDVASATSPAIIPAGAGTRILVVGLGAQDSGIPRDWAADRSTPGVALLADFSDRSVAAIAEVVDTAKRAGDVVVASIHWGPNWGYEVPPLHRRFAHALIDHAGVHIVHGHSSHHPKAIEVYRGRPILYGCGDFLNDYEGIRGYEEFRGDLTLMYLPTLDRTGRLTRFELVPLRIRRLRLEHASAPDREWLHATLDRECRPFGTRIVDRGSRLAVEPA